MRTTQITCGILVLCGLAACGRDVQTPQQAARPTTATHQLPTATEAFHLRSECAKLGQQILDDNVVKRALNQSQISNYNEIANRCYVELTVQTADTTKPVEIMHRYLFDGQTKALLATTAIDKGAKSGIAYNTGIVGFEQVSEYINEKMKGAQR